MGRRRRCGPRGPHGVDGRGAPDGARRGLRRLGVPRGTGRGGPLRADPRRHRARRLVRGPGDRARGLAAADRGGAPPGRGRGAAGRARGLRPRRSHRLLQQPLPGAHDRGPARDPGGGQALRGVAARRGRARRRLPSRDGRGLPQAAAEAAHREGQRARPPDRRRPLGAHPRERHPGRRPGAAHHRHHRGAPPRRPAPPPRARGRAGRRPGGDHRRRARLHLRQPGLRDDDRLFPGRGARPRAAARPLERPARAGVLRRDAPPARGRPHLARHHRQPAPRRPPDRAGDHDLAAPRRVRRHHQLRRGQARRHRRARPGAGARGERGALPRRRRHPDRVHRPRRRRRLLDLHERRGRALHRHAARGHARQGPARHRPDPARGPRGLRAPHGEHHARAADQHGRAARPPPGRQRALGALDRHRDLRRRRQAGRDPVRRTRDHRPQARRGGARGGRAAAGSPRSRRRSTATSASTRPGTSSSSMPRPNGRSAMRAPRPSASRWPS